MLNIKSILKLQLSEKYTGVKRRKPPKIDALTLQ